MVKVKLFTHSDMDGIGCALVAMTVFGKENVDVTYCDYHDVNEKILNFLNNEEWGVYEHIFITDISVNEEMSNLIEQIRQEGRLPLVLLDHHETAEWLNQYEWAHVHTTHEDGTNTAGTSMLYDYLNHPQRVKHFVETVRRYDTWDWHNIYQDDEPKKWNDLFWIYGREHFVPMMLNRLLSGENEFTSQDLLLLDLEQKKINRRINKALKGLIIKNVGRYNIGIVFSEQYINEIAHEIHHQHPQLDLVAVINMSSRSVSYRTDRDDINVGEFAKYFGGGGRPQTAGSEIKDFRIDTFLDILFS